MYAITYTLQTGKVLHRAASAAAALEAMRLLKSGGAHVVTITITRTGKEVSRAQLELLAKDER